MSQNFYFFEGIGLGTILTMLFIAKRNLIILNIFPTNKNIEDMCNPFVA